VILEKNNKKVRLERRTEISDFLKLSSVLCKAFAAIHRTVVPRLERNFASFAARSAYSVKHLTVTALGIASCIFTCIAARFAALRLIGEALFSKKFLLASSKFEFSSAVFAD
jgi:hypothetical protein